MALAAILLVVFLARAGWVAHIQAADRELLRSPDTPSYVLPALALERNGAFTEHPGDPSPMYFRTPGYPAFIAAIYLVAGEHDLAVMFAQVLLSVVVIWLAFVLANRLWGFAEAMVAVIILALDPLQFWASGQYLTEALSTFLVMVMVALGMRVASQRMRQPALALVLGLVLAIATLVRPVTYYLVVLALAFLVVVAVRSRTRVHVLGLAAFAMPCLILVGGWQVRNHSAVGSWRLSGVEGINMYTYRAAGVTAKLQDREFLALHRAFEKKAGPRPRGHAQGAYFDGLFSRGFDIVSSHPIELAKVTAGGFVSETTGVGEEVFPTFFLVDLPGIGEALLSLAIALFWVAAAYGIVRALVCDRRRRAAHVAALAIVGYVLLISAGPDAYWRMRIPVVPVLALYAACGAADASRRIRDVTRRRRELNAG